MFVFTDPTRSGDDLNRPRATPSAFASMGSPTGVPVPCSSTYETSSGATPARRCAARTTDSCAESDGVVRVSAAPPLFTALPRITA